jgi:hypothetical protein
MHNTKKSTALMAGKSLQNYMKLAVELYHWSHLQPLHHKYVKVKRVNIKIGS